MTALYNPFLFPPFLFGIFAEELTRMTDTADETAPPKTGELFKLATKTKHVFGERLIVQPFASPSTHEQHEWKCQCCPLFKITVLPRGREGYRMYRFADGCQFEDSQDPECTPVLTDRGCRP